MKRTRSLTKKEWEVILACLAMAEADEWDEATHQMEQPDFEAIMDKVRERLR